MGGILRNKASTSRTVSARGQDGGSWILFVLVPVLTLISLVAYHTYTCYKEVEVSRERGTHVLHHILVLARLILDMNVEREMTALYVTARTGDDNIMEQDLQAARRHVNTTLASLVKWPGRTGDGYIFQSSSLFSAMLEQRRVRMTSASGTADTDVWVREVLFYTDLIDVFYGWLVVAGDGEGVWAGEVGPWLLAYRQLLGCVNSLGTEQALCSVYHAVVCFGHRETMFYLNYTFSAEAAYRLYRHSYPGLRFHAHYNDDAWRLRDHRDLFPTLATCRRDVVSDMEYIYSLGTVYQTSLCDYARRNNTRCVDVTETLEEESSALVTLIRSAVDSTLMTAKWRYMQWLCVLAIVVLYSVTGTLCTARRLHWRGSLRRTRRHLKFHEHSTSEDQNGGGRSVQQQQQHNSLSEDTELNVHPPPLHHLPCPTYNVHSSSGSRSSKIADNYQHNNHHINGDVHVSCAKRQPLPMCTNMPPASSIPLQHSYNGGYNSLSRIKVATV